MHNVGFWCALRSCCTHAHIHMYTHTHACTHAHTHHTQYIHTYIFVYMYVCKCGTSAWSVTIFSFVIYTQNWYRIITYQTLQHVYLSLSLPPLYRRPCYGCPVPQGEYVPTPWYAPRAIENRNAHSTHSKCGVRAYFNHQTWWHTYHICMSISHEYVHATSLCSSLHKCVHMHPNHWHCLHLTVAL